MLKPFVLQPILDRTEIVEGGVPPFRIVKIIDVVHNPGAGQFGVIKDQVAFEGTEERPSNGIVPAVSSSAEDDLSSRLRAFA